MYFDFYNLILRGCLDCFPNFGPSPFNMSHLKEILLRTCQEEIEKKLLGLRAALADIEASMNNETKSSVGDKHETSRARMQQEQAQLGSQLQAWENMNEELGRIDPQQSGSSVFTGSFIKTSQGNFFVAVALGRISVNNEDVFVISPKSPIGQVMLNLEAGNEFQVNGRSYKITEVL